MILFFLRNALYGLIFLLAGYAVAEPVPVSIVLDDVGYSLKRGKYAIESTGVLSYSILPTAPHARVLAEFAHRHGKEVLLHMPMQSTQNHSNEPYSLTPVMNEQAFRGAVQHHIAAVPHVAGVNNHMGSLLTPMRAQMMWLMQELKQSGLFFVDSRTTHHTVASLVAAQHGVPFFERDAFLDNEKDRLSIEQALQRFLKLAKKQKGGLAIAHPYPATLAVLESALVDLPEQGIRLVSVAELIRLRSAPGSTGLAQTGVAQ